MTDSCTPKPAITERQRQFVDAALELRDAPEQAQRAFVARQLVQATLPHAQPKGSPPEWSRTNGYYTLSIRPGYRTNPKTGQRECLGYPAGSIARLLLFWMTSEAVFTKSRRLELGSSLSGFMKELGLNPRNGGQGSPRSDAARLRLQMLRLFRASISFEYTTTEKTSWLDMPVTHAGELWWDFHEPKAESLFSSWVELGETFYQALVSAPVPVDMRALKLLKNSPLALDVYAWALYKSHTLQQSGKSQSISWQALMTQFGSDYADVKNFGRKFRTALRKVMVVCPQLQIETVHGGLQIHPPANSNRRRLAA